jgi:hypothetical protein
MGLNVIDDSPEMIGLDTGREVSYLIFLMSFGVTFSRSFRADTEVQTRAGCGSHDVAAQNGVAVVANAVGMVSG